MAIEVSPEQFKVMDILFIHQNFPGQFKHLAPALVQRGHRVVALTMQKVPSEQWQGIRLVPYSVSRGTTANVHPWVADFETKTIRAEAAFYKMRMLKKEGFMPDVVVAHPGWGESLFVKEVWPDARLGIYCEFYYHAHGADVNFDPEFLSPDPEAEACRLRLKNINNILHFDIADAGLSPTHWQASTFPKGFRDKITVIHDGIDTDLLVPNPQTVINLNKSTGETVSLGFGDEVITFVNRNLEPYRGYHIFMRALPNILEERPNAHVLIVGGSGVSYGALPDPTRYGGLKTWRDIFIAEVRPKIADKDWARVYFLGNIPYQHFVTLLQVSSVHVYLTYPFVLSWSLLEAMSVSCAIVASDTAPLHEAIRHGETGLLVDFFDINGLAKTVCELLEDAERRKRLGTQARAFAKAHYDLKAICLPRQIDWVEGLPFGVK